MKISPTDIRFKVYNRTDTVGNGTYSNWLLAGADVSIARTLLDGNRLTITSKRKTMDSQIDRVRPVRFFWKEPGVTPVKWVKLFDGCLKEPSYENRSNKIRSLQTIAYGWERELASISLELENQGGVTYVEKTVEEIINDLIRIANSFGMVKQADYVYDSSKIPNYSSVAAAFSSVITRTYSGSIWSALIDLTKVLDIADTALTGEWTIKVDALLSDDHIYIIPTVTATDTVTFGSYQIGAGFTDGGTHIYGLALWLKTTSDLDGAALRATITYTNQDGVTGRVVQSPLIPGTAIAGEYFHVQLLPGDTLVKDVTTVSHSGGSGGDQIEIIGQYTRVIQDVKLNPPKQIQRDYSRLLNYAIIRGKDLLHNRQYSDTPVLDETTVTLNAQTTYDATDPAFWFPEGSRDTSVRSYFRVTITNPTGSDKGGRIEISGNSNWNLPPGPSDLISEYRWIRVPSNSIRRYYTSNRYALLDPGLPTHAFTLTSGFLNCTIKVEEVLYGIAGRSLNHFGLRGKSIRNVDMDTQLKVDTYAQQLVEMYHAPHVLISGELKPDYGDRMDLIGKGLQLYDNFSTIGSEFLCTEQGYVFSGTQVTESFKAIKYNYDWEYVE